MSSKVIAGQDELSALELVAVVVSMEQEQPCILIHGESTHKNGISCLPKGHLAGNHKTLEIAVRESVQKQSDLQLGYVEQLYTFGDLDRMAQNKLKTRAISTAYLALTRDNTPAEDSGYLWRSWYHFLPWEDFRHGQPDIISQHIAPTLAEWLDTLPKASSRELKERLDLAFGLDGAPWDPEKVLERYELLYQAQLVSEYYLDRNREPHEACRRSGQALYGDDRRILATALGRLRGKLKYRPLVFELLPETFTLLELQSVVEALSGYRLHKQNFRRLVEQGGLVEGTGEFSSAGRGRPAEKFRFRREVIHERPAPGLRVR